MSIACMPLVSNVPKPKNRTWTITRCPVCGCKCWETDAIKDADRKGYIKERACTECAIKKTVGDSKCKR